MLTQGSQLPPPPPPPGIAIDGVRRTAAEEAVDDFSAVAPGLNYLGRCQRHTRANQGGGERAGGWCGDWAAVGGSVGIGSI